jgi:hypothetical protein
MIQLVSSLTVQFYRPGNFLWALSFASSIDVLSVASRIQENSLGNDQIGMATFYMYVTYVHVEGRRTEQRNGYTLPGSAGLPVVCGNTLQLYTYVVVRLQDVDTHVSKDGRKKQLHASES